MGIPSGFYGEVGFRERRPDFTLTRLEHARGRRLPTHAHERAYFSLLWRGGYAERFGRTQVVCSARAAWFHPPGIVHRDEIAAGGASFLVVEIGDALYRRALAEGPIAGSRHDLRGGELALAAARLSRECRDAAHASPLVIEGLVLEMLGIVARPARGEAEAPWLTRVLDRLRQDPAPRVTVAELARHEGVHPVRLARAFRRRLGVGVGEYVRALRVRQVEERLADDVPLADLALAAGFVDQSHMTREFKRVTGQTPGAVRERSRRGR